MLNDGYGQQFGVTHYRLKARSTVQPPRASRMIVAVRNMGSSRTRRSGSRRCAILIHGVRTLVQAKNEPSEPRAECRFSYSIEVPLRP